MELLDLLFGLFLINIEFSNELRTYFKVILLQCVPKTTITKSSGKAVYVDGIRVFDQNGRIHVADEKSHTSCPKGTSIEKFFKRYLTE